ncbi:hypothetical protein ACE103_16165 [Bradyrhizobium sp. ma5]|uniref:COG3904 family protein n=1 Tax=Bradyrhizobium sp. ma5 TaxID=3344828 RepID=UPI0035D4C27E
MQKFAVMASTVALMSMTFLCEPINSAEIKSGNGKSAQGGVIWITGEILPGDADKFALAVRQANGAGKFVANVRLNSEGGNLLEGAKLADAIRYGKMSTNVGKTSICASACFLLFAAGSTKFASYGAQIGVHGASEENGRETVSSNAATISMAKIAKELGVPPSIIGRMVVTPPSEMVWLSPQDLQSMGATMMGKPDQSVAAAQPIEPGQVAHQLPEQTRPGEPMDLLERKQSSKSLTWENLVDVAVRLSAQQNGGQAKSFRNCQPEMKICNSAVAFVYDGTNSMIRVTRDINDQIIEREFCTFNTSADIRSCFDWDTKRTHRDMKDARGNWTKVADE